MFRRWPTLARGGRCCVLPRPCGMPMNLFIPSCHQCILFTFTVHSWNCTFFHHGIAFCVWCLVPAVSCLPLWLTGSWCVSLVGPLPTPVLWWGQGRAAALHLERHVAAWGSGIREEAGRRLITAVPGPGSHEPAADPNARHCYCVSRSCVFSVGPKPEERVQRTDPTGQSPRAPGGGGTTPDRPESDRDSRRIRPPGEARPPGETTRGVGEIPVR